MEPSEHSLPPLFIQRVACLTAGAPLDSRRKKVNQPIKPAYCAKLKTKKNVI